MTTQEMLDYLSHHPAFGDVRTTIGEPALYGDHKGNTIGTSLFGNFRHKEALDKLAHQIVKDVMLNSACDAIIFNMPNLVKANDAVLEYAATATMAFRIAVWSDMQRLDVTFTRAKLTKPTIVPFNEAD